MSTREAVLVTGASTGIGRAIVERLRTDGVRVFAAVRDLSTVDEHPLVTAVRLDVTSVDEARAAATTVTEALGDARLRGVVNNAGVAVGGPLEFLDLDEMRRQLEVNVVGQLAVTQAFLPLLRERGPDDPRIVFTSSIGGRVAAPYIGPYAASKHALNGMAESLRRELLPWGFSVSVLMPATVSTPIWDKGVVQVDEVVAGMPPRAVELYGEAIESMRGIAAGANDAGIPASVVADAAHHALFSSRPKAEYLVGREAKMMATVSSALPYRTFDKLVLREMRKS
ncbi:SDR family NAD(P)-dependent oxidoreductase [Aeromicrobium terrae]|uniref:SDR family NAD(P)-dependent oxidoreductase n=1 Tax=Aeromicrobium terrae TaxID=2498846 RepID=A0A5C8NKF3_9ACTN|nr:SDR family NAD(P)-dependent oxidoreductase [Aeromicrobium terrae]TXL61517.1 SDR family NAD(P)-dependent oxidoreductase [Aeromicrobium terrae]